MTSIDRKKMAESLKILAENPDKIKAVEKLYQQRLSEIKAEEKGGNLSPNAVAKKKAEAKEARDRTTHLLAHAMRPALEYVKANNDYTTIPIDLESSKLSRALDVASLLGRSMMFSDQVGILNQFRGDPSALRVLEATFRKNGNTWAADVAKEMQKPISTETLDQMNEVLSFFEYYEAQGRFNFPAERMMWTHGNFKKQADRLGLDLDGVADPYSLMLDMTLDSLEETELANMQEADSEEVEKSKARIAAQRYKIELAKREIANGADPAKVVNKALSVVNSGGIDA